MTTPITRPLAQYAHSDVGVPKDSLVLADGSIWSHAATLGTRIKGGVFTIDAETVRTFVKNFTTGYRRKVPVDYDHAITNGAAGSGGPTPKAGDVLELKAVLSTADFSGDLQRTAEKIAAAMGRPLDDPRNLGLWMRWRPTARALQMLTAGEYSELSIAFDMEYPHNETGESQGPTLLAVALTNLPFLDDMLSTLVAAALGGDSSPAAPAPTHKEQHMTTPNNVRLLTAVAALSLGAAPSDEDQAITQLAALGPEIKQLRALRDGVLAESGETDIAKVPAKIKELRAENQRYATEAKDAKARELAVTVDATMKKFEKRFRSVPERKMYERNLTAELTAGTKLEETETHKLLSALKDSDVTGQFSAGDSGDAPADDVKLDTTARELMNSDPDLKALAQTDRTDAYIRALKQARRELAIKTA
jgi:cytochrome c556